jgi:phytoene dehydrogenase-like protein
VSTPAPPTTFTTRRAGIRQALVDADIVGRSVYHPSGLDQAKAPYIVLSDGLDTTTMIFGDARPIAEAVVGEARLYQANSRDADPTLAPRMFAALQGLRFTVTTGSTAHQVTVRAISPTITEAEGLDERIVRWTAYQTPGTP